MIGVRCVAGSIVYLLRAKDWLWMMYDWSVCIFSAGCKPKIVSSLYYSWFHINAYLLISFSPHSRKKRQYLRLWPPNISIPFHWSWVRVSDIWRNYHLAKRAQKYTIQAMAAGSFCIPQEITFRVTFREKWQNQMWLLQGTVAAALVLESNNKPVRW